jgi:hypothetical protein
MPPPIDSNTSPTNVKYALRNRTPPLATTKKTSHPQDLHNKIDSPQCDSSKSATKRNDSFKKNTNSSATKKTEDLKSNNPSAKKKWNWTNNKSPSTEHQTPSPSSMICKIFIYKNKKSILL